MLRSGVGPRPAALTRCGPAATGCCAGPRVAPPGGRPTDRGQHSADDEATVVPAAAGDPLSPQILGPYELDELLGRGRAGEVHRAWDTRRHRTVALRILPPGLTADAPFRDRFDRACRAAAGIDEPHVVRVHEWGEIDGRVYLDTELVDGRDLSAVLAAQGPLPAALAVDVVSQVAAGLDAAHARGLVHGDVRPGTVLLSGHSAHPECHLVDLPLAAASGGGTGGTPGYTAPERLAGRPADHRADVYALAGLLSELLAGRPPAGPGAAGEGERRPQPGTPGSGTAGSVPAALAAVVARGRAEDPDERHGSAGGLAGAARAALAPDTVPRPAAPPAPAAGTAARGVRETVPAVARPAASSGSPRPAAVGNAPGASPLAAGGGRHRRGAAALWSGHRGSVVAAVVAGVLALVAGGGVVATRLASDSSDATTSTPVAVEPADDPGADPFVPAPARSGTATTTQGTDEPATGGTADPTADGADPTAGSADPTAGTPGTTEGTPETAEGTPGPSDGTEGSSPGTAGPTSGADDPTSSGADAPGSAAGTPAAAAGSPVAGDRPGLYGGTGAEVCDPAAMAAFLAEHPDRAAAFAGVEELPSDGIDDWLATLTPVVLRFDTAVTNHGFADGRATPFQSVLQAGTAVLVDDSGVPQVRCICGNPLEPPAARPAPEYEGDQWPGFAPDTVVVVGSSPATVPAFVLVDDATGAVAARPVGTTGDVDRAVDPVVAEQARGFGTQRAPSSSGTGTPSAVPSAADPSGDGSGGTGPTPPDGSAGTGPTPTGGQGPAGNSSSGGTPDPSDTGQPDEYAPDSGSGGDQPGEGQPGEGQPGEGGSADETATDQTPAEQAPTDQAPIETPTDETPADQTPTDRTPVEETAAEQAPTETPAEATPTGDAPTEEPTDEPAAP